MLTKTPFYAGITRKMIVSVGGLFNNLHIRTFDENGVTQKIIKVPLAYANKEKFVQRLQQDPGQNKDNLITLPRLSFEIVNYSSDHSRQLNKVQKMVAIQDGRTVYSYSPVPYELTFHVYSYTRTQEDNLQILEQIVPYFTPDMNLSIKVLTNPDVTQDCPLTLNSVVVDDTYDGGFEQRRYIISTYSFTLKMNYFAPFLGTSDPENHFDSGASSGVIKKVITNVNTGKYTAEVNPFEANKDDPHTIIEGWED